LLRFSILLSTEIYQKGKVVDKSLPYIVLLLLLVIHEIPALVLLYIANSHQPVYLGSLLKNFYGHGVSNPIVYTPFLIFETAMIVFTILNAAFFAFVYMTITKSVLFWVDELA
jgi:hypothetical protein